MSAPAVPSVTGPALDAAIAELSGETLVELLERATARTPESVLMVIRRGMADERWTYQQLSERSERVAETLQGLGVGPGSHVLTWSQNDPWLVVAYFAAWRLGAVIVPLDLRMQTDVAVRIAARTEPSVLLAGQGVDADAAAALAVPVISVDEAGLVQPDGSPRTARGGAPERRVVAPDDVAEILFTSGTTSDPKGVVLTHGQVIHSARAIAQTGMGNEPDRALGIIPLSHMYGQSVPLLMGMMSGSTLVFLHTVTLKAIAATMKREHITAVAVVPQLIDIIMQGIESEARRSGREASLARARRIARWLPFGARRLLFRSVLEPLGGTLQIITSGSARLPEELQAAWESMGIRVVQGYGTTECAVICGHSRRRQQPGTVGPPLAGIEVRIAADGELLARGPNVMQGYWQAPEATAEVLDADGWLHTGDAARIDAAGDVVILGRTRDRIALPNGFNVYPEDLESALRETGLIRAALAFEEAPGRLVAALVPLDGDVEDTTLDEAVRTANARLAPHQRIGAWRRWPEDDFPRTHTLKVRPGPVKSWYADAARSVADAPQAPAVAASPDAAANAAASSSPAPAASSPAPASSGRSGRTKATGVSLDAVTSLVATVIAETRGGEPLTIEPDTPMASLELDSLTTVSLALRIEETFDAPLSDDEVGNARDVAALHALIEQRQGQPPAAPPSRWAFAPAATWLRRVLDATFTSWAVGLVARPRFVATDRLDDVSGPVLVCPNHTSHLDAPLVRAGLPAHLRERSAIAAAADAWFDGSPAGPAVALVLGAFPFGRASDVRASLERVADLANDGWSVIIFPEGTRSADGQMVEMRHGIGLLATGLRIPIVPVHISGAHEVLPRGSWLPRHRRGHGITVRYGAPLHIDPEASIQDATQAIGQAIEELGRETGAARAQASGA